MPRVRGQDAVVALDRAGEVARLPQQVAAVEVRLQVPGVAGDRVLKLPLGLRVLLQCAVDAAQVAVRVAVPGLESVGGWVVDWGGEQVWDFYCWTFPLSTLSDLPGELRAAVDTAHSIHLTYLHPLFHPFT